MFLQQAGEYLSATTGENLYDHTSSGYDTWYSLTQRRLVIRLGTSSGSVPYWLRQGYGTINIGNQTKFAELDGERGYHREARDEEWLVLQRICHLFLYDIDNYSDSYHDPFEDKTEYAAAAARR